MDTLQRLSTAIGCLSTFQRCRVVLVLMSALLSAACASQKAKVPEPESLQPFPEVRQITFTGNTHFSSGTLRKLMATQQRPLLPPWKRGEPYNPPTLDADLLRLKKYYFDRGFLECIVRVDRIQEDPEQRTVRIVIALDEGQPTLVTTVSLAGTIPPQLPAAAKLLADLPLRPQQHLNKEDFDRSKTLLLTRLHNASYARAQVIPQTEVDPEHHTAAVTFTLVPGAQTVFGHFAIKGEKQVEERAIRRQLTIHEGQLVSDKDISASADAIYNLGMFHAVTPRALNPEAADKPLDVEFEVRERLPRSFQVGLGYSTTEGFHIEAQWTHRNLWRGAQQLTLSTGFSAIEQKLEARVTLPYFLAARTAFSNTLFVRNQKQLSINPAGTLFGAQEGTHTAFDLFSYGDEARVEHHFTETVTGVVGLNLSRNDFYDVNEAALTEFEQEIAQDNTLLIQFVEMQWNTSRSLLNPTEGMVLRGRIDNSNTALVSDFSFVKLLLEERHYIPLGWNLLLATRLKVGGIQPYGPSTEVPFNVRFFAGGPGSVRGFPLNQLGPVNKDGDPIGGMSLLEGSVELRFPLFGDFGAVVFVDAGNVFASSFTYRLDDLRYAAGPGLRYKTPVGPIRLDVGFIVDRRPGDNFGRVEISIGQAF
jgi:outer membrane protein insertion porin family